MWSCCAKIDLIVGPSFLFLWWPLWQTTPTWVFSPPGSVREQAAIYNSRLCCKAFNQAFLDYPHLSHGLVLKRPLRSLNSLTAWLQRHHGSVHAFAGFVGSPTVELHLDTLSQRPSTLRTALQLIQAALQGMLFL